MTEALIFDCDGTLADSMPTHYRAWLDALQPYGIGFPEDRFYSLGGMPTIEIARLLLGEAGRHNLDPAAMADDKERRFLLRFDDVKPIANVIAIARTGRGRVPMAVASGGRRAIVDRTLRHLHIFDWFTALVAAEDTLRHKPEPDVFLEAARRLDAEPSACTVYEDTDIGLEAARRAGMRGIDVRKL